ncbi:retrovirus-related pol polyprotein from transposon TNT 1-94 [Tanacetum coccineum]
MIVKSLRTVICRGIRKKGLYVMKLGNKSKDKICLAMIDGNSTLWHRRLGHANMHLIQLLASKELVRNLPKLKFDQHFCDACKIGKQAHVSHKAKNIVSTTRCLKLLHMDICRYSQNSKAYIILNKHTRKIEESLNVTFDEAPPLSKTSPLVDDDLDEEEAIREIEKKNQENVVEDETLEIDKITGVMNLPKIHADEFEMSMMGELNFFLGLHIKQMEDGIFFNQSKYIKEMLKKFGLKDSKPMKIPMSSDTKLMKDEECESVDSTKYRGMIGIETVVYADSDHAGDYVDRKSTSGICTFVGCCLTSWFLKKQTALAISTTEAEYVSAEKACQQALWMKQALIDYDVTMLRATGLDHQKTRNYIPLISNEFNQPLLNTMENLEKRYFHEGRVVSPNFKNMSHIRVKFESIGFDFLLDINEQIVPRFDLEFYCLLTFTYNLEDQFVVNFVIQNISFSLTLEEFSQILKIPFKDQASNTEMWSLDHLSVSVPSRGLYKTKSPSPRVFKNLIQVPRQGQETRTKNKKTIVVGEHKILTREIQTHMKPWVDIICENTICIGGHRDHVFACLCHMLYCIETSTPYNLAFFILKRMEKTRFKPKELLPYGMLLTRLFKHVVSVSPELAFDHYLSHDRTMHPLAPHYERKTRADRGMKRPRESNASSSSTTQNHPSSSRPLDHIVDENDDESFHSNSSSPSQQVSSSSNVASRVRQNPSHESHDLNIFLSETITLQTQQRNAHRDGLRSIGQALKNMMGGKRK